MIYQKELKYWRMVESMSKTIENMKPDENPYLEKPDDFDPARRNQNKKYGGGGKSNDSKK